MKKFDNFKSNLDVLLQAENENLDSEFVLSGINAKFSIQFELGWKVLKELLDYEGVSEAKTGSPKSIIKSAFSVYSFMDENVWVDMYKNRNAYIHIYDGSALRRLTEDVMRIYIPEFVRMRDNIEMLYADEGIL